MHHTDHIMETVSNGITQTFVSTLDKLDISLADLSNEEGFVQITMVTLVVYRDIQVDNVSAPQFPGIGNAVANHLVYRPILNETSQYYVQTLFGKK